MSIVLGDLHNLVRTYQRVLDLDATEPVPRSRESAQDPEIRVSISSRARELARSAGQTDGKSNAESRP